MRTLLLFRGSMGCGKSTFIKEHNLERYAISIDNIRLLCQSPILNTSGNYEISCRNDDFVWNLAMQIIENRMERGEFIVIDACNTKTEEMNRYKKIAAEYKYRILCIDMTDIPIDVVKERNRLRQPSYKVVPEHSIENAYARFETQVIPSGIKRIKPDEFEKEIQFNTIDLSNWKKIHHIGDIHGCYTALMEYLKDGLKDDELYIFLGDFCDRGIENAKVLKFLMSIYDKENVIMLTGNHEKHLWDYANDRPSTSRIFENSTRIELDEAEIDKKQLRLFYRRLRQIAYYTYNDKVVFVSHGGVSNLPENPMFIATIQFINGVGKYEDTEEVDNSFIKNTPNNAYQIHGHRNGDELPIQLNERCFCLENEVEFGGTLRVVTLNKDGFECHEIQNEVFRVLSIPQHPSEMALSPFEAIAALQSNKLIKVKNIDNISSFNFKPQAFKHGIWDEQTITARGLFMNINNGKVVMRSYNKFFNINEKEYTKLGNLRRTLNFPLTAYVKYNGYLGMNGYDEEKDVLLTGSKSDIYGPYADWFKKIQNDILGEEKMKLMTEYIKQNNCSLVWEVIDPINDPHIIEYKEPNIILLSIVKNDLSYQQLPYDEIIKLANMLGVDYKEKAFVFDDWKSFKDWYDSIIHDSEYKYNGEYIEGFVLEDASGFMTKMKLEYYKFWKFMRSLAEEVMKFGYCRHTSRLFNPNSNRFYGWLRTQDKYELRKDIIYLRNKYYNENK